MFTVNCLNPGVMSSLRFPPFNRKHFVSLGEDKSLKGEGGGPQVGEVTRLGKVKNNPPLHAILQTAFPGCTFLRLLNGR